MFEWLKLKILKTNFNLDNLKIIIKCNNLKTIIVDLDLIYYIFSFSYSTFHLRTQYVKLDCDEQTWLAGWLATALPRRRVWVTCFRRLVIANVYVTRDYVISIFVFLFCFYFIIFLFKIDSRLWPIWILD